MPKKVMDFKSKEAYGKWLGYVKANDLDKAPGNTPIKIKGKTHKVNHKSK
jgi:hypothetical protein